ncbi:class I adenylate-forming enzyme family protein [Actinacidiphila paucisporea]|uniref:Acyl-CoA synthetase (AMP-forming)/AMP-acid ligase II n=1 Tax=Actinacidiphila paucisporea TaxID=310782 RepID=A0A1M7MK24_9ACTN|nr:class I adenylate-forming enzyme family protein [Actinacidiphila paucisporea]SHM91226.1 Acyl-CoA synthetase (AMP-forming)/AMP-acid ligase II [Actinacidiphila paucisporea]
MSTRRLRPAAGSGAPVALTVPRLLAARAAAEPAHIAVTQGADTLDLATWQARTQGTAAGLREAGVRPGDRVGLLYGARDWIAYACSYTGVLAAGAVAVPMSTRTAPAEVAYMLEHSGATALLHGADVERFNTQVRLRWGPRDLAHLPAAGSVGGAPSVAPAGPAPAAGGQPVVGPVVDGPRPGDPAQILYTSGTTGRPKGVIAAHANLTHGARLDPPLRTLAHSRQFLHAFPIGTNAGQTMLFNALTSHAGMLVTARFGPEHFARLIEQQAVGSVFVVPAMAIELLASGALGRHDTSGVVLFGSTAAALPPTVAAGLAAALPGATIVNYYTSTEAAPTQTSMIFSPERPAAIGLAVAGGALRVCDEAGRPCPAGVTGEVWMRSAGAPRSYLDDPAATSQVFRGGWTRMGDIGYLDADGYLFLVDRESDLIKSGADKVSTLAVEAALHEHPEIVEAAVLGLPDPVLGRAPAAVLVATRELRLAEVRRFLATRLAGHEQPSRIVHVAELPRNAGGKVVKSRLRALFDPAPDTRAAGEEAASPWQERKQ